MSIKIEDMKPEFRTKKAWATPEAMKAFMEEVKYIRKPRLLLKVGRLLVILNPPKRK